MQSNEATITQLPAKTGSETPALTKLGFRTGFQLGLWTVGRVGVGVGVWTRCELSTTISVGGEGGEEEQLSECMEMREIQRERALKGI